MVQTKVDSATTTDMTNTVENYSVSPGDDTNQDREFTPEWTKWKGFLDQIPELNATINKKATWTVGKGYKAKPNVKKILKKIRGNGKETFNSILYKAIVTYTTCGDYFAEIIKLDGRLKNIKTLNPGTIKIITDRFGFIKKYEQHLDGKLVNSWKPEEIFHLSWNQIGDNTHGTSTIEKLTYDKDQRPGVIEMYNEAKQDMKTVFHRYVKPLIISHIDTDDETEIATFKGKLDKTVKLGENLVVPKDTVEMERMSIPQYSTLDPLPWIQSLQKEFLKADGVPDVILGEGSEATEATAKIIYLAFQQMIEWNQLFLEEQVEAQLGLEINLEFPASLEQNLQSSERKSRSMNNMEMNPNEKK